MLHIRRTGVIGMLNKEKFAKEIEDILAKTVAVSKSGEIYRCVDRVNCDSCDDCIFCNDDCIEGAKVWLNSEYKKSILDEVEKEYLKAVIKPFKKHVKTIMKAKQVATLYAITIDIEEKYNYETFLQFPPFEKSSEMYKGMELGKEYTLKELGLDND